MTLKQLFTPKMAIKTLVADHPGVFEQTLREWREVVDLDIFWTSVWGPISKTLLDCIHRGEASKAHKVLAYAEVAMRDGTERTKDAVATWFLEAIVEEAYKHEEVLAPFIAAMGPHSKAHCRIWLKMSGQYNKNLED